MSSIWSTIEQLANGTGKFFLSLNVPLLLMIGTGLLAIGLLVLALTRWGHSRPVLKCVLLSVVAHLLLIIYASGTHWMSPQMPTLRRAAIYQPMQVQVVDIQPLEIPEPAGLETEAPEPKSAIWDRIAETAAPSENIDLLPTSGTPGSSNELAALPLMPSEPVSPSSVEPAFSDRALPLPSASRLPIPDLASIKFASIDNAVHLDSAAENSAVAPQPIDFERAKTATATPAGPALSFDAAPAPGLKPLDRRPDTDAIPVPDVLPSASSMTGSFDTPTRLPTTANRRRDAIQAASARGGPRSTANLVSPDKVFSSPVRLADGNRVPSLYALRNAVDRQRVLQQRGGSAETEQAVERALQWLAKNQQSDGRWDPVAHGAGTESRVFGHDRQGAGANADTGITGLAVLAFLAGGHSHMEGPYRENLTAALNYLARQQRDTGSLAGDARLFARMYCHSMALLAISESLAMTGDSNLKPVVEKGVEYSVQSQNRYDGGWRYQPGDAGDMSQFGWQVLALHSAKLGGVAVPGSATGRMNKFIDACASGSAKGLASYQPGQGPSTTMTAESLVCRILLEQDVPPSLSNEAVRQIGRQLPSYDKVNLYYWYYGTLAMYFHGGESWSKWNAAMKEALVTTQQTRGEDVGSWNPDGIWGGYGGRVYSTALSALILEVYYRYEPRP